MEIGSILRAPVSDGDSSSTHHGLTRGGSVLPVRPPGCGPRLTTPVFCFRTLPPTRNLRNLSWRQMEHKLISPQKLPNFLSLTERASRIRQDVPAHLERVGVTDPATHAGQDLLPVVPGRAFEAQVAHKLETRRPNSGRSAQP